ncbi:hypothetical protein Skr01_29550 [Sphaerisporangium krabiense]|nr:hypothetical protein Skr01_29550 [Sphaerisporangium krabiense]
MPDHRSWTESWTERHFKGYLAAMAKGESGRAKGHVEQLPSGSFRMKVYAGTDPTTGKERRYRKTVKTEIEALETLAKLLRDAEPRPNASRKSRPLSTMSSRATSKSPTWRCRPARPTRATSAVPSALSWDM